MHCSTCRGGLADLSTFALCQAIVPHSQSFETMVQSYHILPSSALDIAVRALQIQDYQVIDWIPPSQASAVRTLFEILGADGAQGIRAAMQFSGEPPVA